MKSLTEKALLICFAAVLLIVPISGILQPDQLVTPTENRALQQLPKYEPGKYGAYMKALESYVTDQFPAREKLLSAYTQILVHTGRYMVRNLYVLDDNWLLPREYERTSDWQVKIFTETIEKTTEQYPNIKYCFMLVPYKTGALYRLSPDIVDNYHASYNYEDLSTALKNIDNLLTVDVVEYFENSCTEEDLKEMYFKTDFHWNANGALKAMEYLQQSMVMAGFITQEEQVSNTDIQISTLNLPFQGDLSRELSNAVWVDENPPILFLKNTDDLQYYQSVDDTKPIMRSEVISAGITKPQTTYNDIYTENLGYYRSINPNAQSKKRVLVLKDSFQNPTTDFLTAMFQQVDVIDPRYYKEPYTFEQIINIRKPDIVLFMFHQSNFSSELVTFLKPK